MAVRARMVSLKNRVLLEEALQCVAVKVLVLWNQLDDARQVRKQVALVPVGKDGGNSRVVKFDVLIVDLDEVDIRIRADQGSQCGFDS